MPDSPTVYSPSDILNIVKEHLKTSNIPVVIEGVYNMVGSHAYNGGIWWYDEIKSQFDNSKLKAMVPTGIRNQLNQNDVVQLSGTISKTINDYDGKIELLLRVSSLVGKQVNVISDEEMHRLQLLQKKAAVGSKPVDSLLESILYSDERKPRVALLYAENSVTDKDFQAGIQAASGRIDFKEFRKPFSDVAGFAQQINEIDQMGFDVVCVVRGGGSGLEVFDKPEMAMPLLNMATPTITAIGHDVDSPLACKVADRNVSTPSILGQFFKDLVEQTNEKKSRSQAALTEKIKRQYQQQLEAGQKQNKELQEKLTLITKTYDEAQKRQADAMLKLQNQLKEQAVAGIKQAKDFASQLNKMQETNRQLQNNLNKVSSQNTDAVRSLSSAQQQIKNLERQLQEKHSNTPLLVSFIIAVAIIVFLVAIIVYK